MTWSYVFGGESFEIADELDVGALFALGDFAELMVEGQAAEGDEGGLDVLRAFVHLRSFTSSLFQNEADFARWMALKPTQPQLLELVQDAIKRSTGSGLGEVSRPSGSSDGDTASARPTSLGSTG